MIWEGERANLGNLGVPVVMASDLRRYDRELVTRRTSSSQPILLHGGGNFGDVWPVFQRGREQVIADFPCRRIVQLPQTVRFDRAENAARTNRIISRHPDFTLMVRDTTSYDHARLMLPDAHIVLSPDAALGWDVGGTPAPEGSVLVLARTDHERRFELADAMSGRLTSGDTVADWRISGPAVLAWHAAKTPGRLTSAVPRLRGNAVYRRFLESAGDRLRELNLRHALSLFSGRRLVVTDRLHAHVLATLLGIPNIVLDNSYGKVSAIIRDYTGRFSTTQFVASLEEAQDAVADLAALKR